MHWTYLEVVVGLDRGNIMAELGIMQLRLYNPGDYSLHRSRIQATTVAPVRPTLSQQRTMHAVLSSLRRVIREEISKR